MKRTVKAAARKLPAVSLGLAILITAMAGLAAERPEKATAGKAAAAPPAEYRLGPDDVIDVFVWKEPDLSSSVVVRPDGKISLPLASELQASGRTVLELEREIAEKLRQYISEPVVNVIVKQVNSVKISVLGEVRRPDVYRIKNRVTVLDAIAMAGGFTEFAKRDRVFILRNGASGQQQRYRVNIKQVVEDQGGQPVYLYPLDTVYVE